MAAVKFLACFLFSVFCSSHEFIKSRVHSRWYSFIQSDEYSLEIPFDTNLIISRLMSSSSAHCHVMRDMLWTKRANNPRHNTDETKTYSTAAWPHFLICYNSHKSRRWFSSDCGLTAFSNLLQRSFFPSYMPFCCGLTASSNLLQPLKHQARARICCGLTAFSNLLQQQSISKDWIISCGLTAFSNLLQLTAKSFSWQICCGLTAFSNLLQLFARSRCWRSGCGLTAFSNLLQLHDLFLLLRSVVAWPHFLICYNRCPLNPLFYKV